MSTLSSEDRVVVARHVRAARRAQESAVATIPAAAGLPQRGRGSRKAVADPPPAADPAEARMFMRWVSAQEERPVYRQCGYCGRPCVGPACNQHRDLVAIEQAELAA